LRRIFKPLLITLIATLVLVCVIGIFVYRHHHLLRTVTPVNAPSGSITVRLEDIPIDSFLPLNAHRQPLLVARLSDERVQQLIALNSHAMNGQVIDTTFQNLVVLSQLSPDLGCLVTELAESGPYKPPGFLDVCANLVFDSVGRAMAATVHPEISRQRSHYPDMKPLNYQLNAQTGEIEFSD
jgi:hypothetical protein